MIGMADSAEKEKEYKEKKLQFPQTVEAQNTYFGFNWMDPVVGEGKTPEERERNKKLRQAISIAMDWEEYIQIFEKGLASPAHGPLPPGLFGYREDGAAAFNPVVYEKSEDGLVRRKSIEEAKKTGAMALFGEKYGENVRVVCMGDFSKEFCGGTHVANTANIRLFKIVSESGVAAGVRRIEALTDKGVLKYYEDLERLVKEASEAAKTESVQLVRRIHTMNDEIKALSSENEKLKAELANNALGDVSDNVVDVKGVKFVATKVDNVDMNELRNLGDKIKTEIGSGVVLVVSATGSDKVNMIAMATDDAVAKGAHSGNLIKAVASLVGGGGGGRPNMAQAGGKNPEKAGEAIEAAAGILEGQLH